VLYWAGVIRGDRKHLRLYFFSHHFRKRNVMLITKIHFGGVPEAAWRRFYGVPQLGRRWSKSGSFAKFAAIRRASSRVRSLAADRRPGLSSYSGTGGLTVLVISASGMLSLKLRHHSLDRASVYFHRIFNGPHWNRRIDFSLVGCMDCY
jgi:hypothetical protein